LIESLEIYKDLVAKFPNVPDYHNNVAGALVNLARAANAQHDFTSARKWLDEAIPFHQAALDTNPDNPTFKSYYCLNLAARTVSNAAAGQRSEAVAAAKKCKEVGLAQGVNGLVGVMALVESASAIETMNELDPEHRQAETQFYLDEAMNMLHNMVAEGYTDLETLKSVSELDPLRNRKDFHLLLDEMAKEMKVTAQKDD
jgi:tetratricopeptide (TPR) repeat protein